MKEASSQQLDNEQRFNLLTLKSQIRTVTYQDWIYLRRNREVSLNKRQNNE
jgi:hypothetical protein